MGLGISTARLLMIALSVVAIVAATLLASPAQRTESGREWLLASQDAWLTDAISNVVLFMPFGWSLAFGRSRRRTAILAALFLSIAIECMQWTGVAGGRTPTLADILTNVAGGAAGFALFTTGTSLLVATGRRALVLAWTWTAGAAAALLLVCFAMSVPAPGPTPLSWQRSPLPHVPGLGWFEAFIDSVNVLDAPVVRQRGTGPVILSTSRMPHHVTAHVNFRGRDVTPAFVPMLFLHAAGDTTPTVMLGQHGLDAELRVARRAAELGLTFPALVLRGAFVSAADSGEALALVVRSDARSLTLETARGAGAGRVTLLLTPAIGWSLLQTVVPVQSPMASLLSLAWLALLVLPAAWWAASTHKPVATCTGLVLAYASLLVVLPRAFGLAPISSVQMLMLAIGFCGTAILGRHRSPSEA